MQNPATWTNELNIKMKLFARVSEIYAFKNWSRPNISIVTRKFLAKMQSIIEGKHHLCLKKVLLTLLTSDEC